jgi:threonine aldolase
MTILGGKSQFSCNEPLEAGAHIFNYEAGGVAALSGVTCRLIQGQRGIFSAADVLAALRPADVHHSPVKLVCIENTHNVGAGSVWPMAALSEVSVAARSHGLAVHMDGARLWNAAVASGIPESQFASHCDSISVCFSKGLGAPVGSALVGGTEFIHRARRFRKMWGGGMRQAGILAAGALYALRHHRHRMAEDHANARKLAEGLARIKGVELATFPPETNIVRFKTPGRNAPSLVTALKERQVLVFDTGPDSVRAVTHLDVTTADIERAIEALAQVMGQ